MRHISEMSQLFANVVSRDQVLRERVVEFIKTHTGLELSLKQVMIGQTLVVLQQMTFAERTVIGQKCDMAELISFVNKNEHDFVIHDVIIR